MSSKPFSAAARQSSGPGALRRLLHINARLTTGRRVTAISLATELEVCDRTIKRDIALLRDEHGAEIVWEPTTATYFCAKPSEHLPLLRLSADEAIALNLAGKTFAAWGGSPLGRALRAALGKIGQVVGNSVSVPADTISDLVSQPDEAGAADATRRWFALLLEAIHHRKTLQLAYRKPKTGAAAEERRVDPLHLAYLDHEWTLIAHDHLRSAPRKFLLTRIEALHHTGRGFLPPQNFEIHTYLAGGFGRYVGGPLQDVRLRFDAYAAPFIRERRWHPSQTIQDTSDGGIEVGLRVSHLLDVQRWVLSWGSHAEALAPVELRDAVTREITVMAACYKAPPPVPPPQ